MDVMATAAPERVAPTARRPFPIPRPRDGVAPLARVHALLDRASGGVALVRAPAGYGKTSQLALWAADGDRPVAWATLGRRDADAVALAARITSMLRAVDPPGDGDVATLRTVRMDREERIGSAAQAFRGVGHPVVLVLDDVHLVDDPSTLDVLGAVAASVPPGSTLVLSGRDDPHVPLGRLRIEDRVVDVTATDLALTPDDARAIFEAAGSDLGDELLARCVETTEGWPVGLRLAAHALSEEPDLPLDRLARDRYLAECVDDEWLRDVGADDLDFLMRVSGLEWMSAPLCDAVLGRADSGARLDALSRRHLLVVPLDRRGDAYRTHRLVRDVLDARFERLDREARRTVDRAASEWFEHQGDADRAVRHAVRAGDDDRVEQLVIRHAAATHTRGGYEIARGWLDQLPHDRVARDPAMCLIAALTAVGLGRDEEAAAWVRLGSALAPTAPGETPDPTHLELITLGSLLSSGPLGPALADARRACELLAPGIWHAAACHATGALGFAAGLDDLAAAQLADGAAEAWATGAVTVRANCRAQLAALVGERGDWTDASAMARDARQLLRQHGLDDMPSLVVVTAVSAHVEALAGDPVAARADLVLTRRNLAYVSTVATWANVQARLSLANASLLLGDRAGARVLAEEAEAYLRTQPDAVGSLERLHDVVERLRSARSALPVGPSSLTTAELRVLHLLPTNLTMADIAERLYVSRNTAKSHAAAVYRKFGVRSRGDAVDVARQAGLLPAYELPPASDHPGSTAIGSPVVW